MRKAILLVAYGFATIEGRRVLDQLDMRVRTLFPDFAVRWAYSSSLLRTRLAKSRCKSDSVGKALQKLGYERYSLVVIQPLQTIPGREYDEMRAQVESVRQSTQLTVRVGLPLLTSDEDVRLVGRSLLRHLPQGRERHEDVIFMGHGSKHPAGERYYALHEYVQTLDPCVHVGTMQGACDLDYLLPRIRSERVWLMPLLATVGRHTLHDMAGRQRASWRSQIEAEGHCCLPVLKGTAEQLGILEIWLEHLRKAIEGDDGQTDGEHL